MGFADRPTPPRGPVVAAGLGLAAVLSVAVLGATGILRLVPAPEPEPMAVAPAMAVPSAPAPAVGEPPPLRIASRVVVVGRDGTLGKALARLGLDGAQAREILEALDGQVDFAKVRPGDQVRLDRAEGEVAVRRLSFRQGPADEWIVEPKDGALAAHKRPVEITTQLARVGVEIESSPCEAFQKAGEDPVLAVMASDVLAWDVDFYQDVRSGDRMTVLVDKVYADGRLLRFGQIRGVEYQGEVASRRLYLWTDPGGTPGYYDDDGASAKRGFLKSPLKYAHLTSRFGSRVHPVLGYTRSHRGVDYAAPVGTPVWAMGDGVVTRAGTNGECGEMVAIRHRNGMTTEYCHLSRIAVKPGQRVAQKQVIGASGRSGLASGPHLHYALKRGGSYANPLALRLPREAPVPEKWRPEFAKAVEPLRAQLAEGAVVQK